MSEWETCQIGEIADLIQGLAINAQSKHLVLNNDKGLPLLRIKDLLEDNQEIFIDEENVPASCIAEINDLIFTRTGQVGFVFMGKKGVVHNNCFRIVPKDNRLHLPFLYNYLNRKNVREYLGNISAGSVQSDMTHSIFKTVEIPLPPLPEQKAIASVLSSLDDKIDLLHRQNKTLEAMAETLFRQWFVEEAQEDWEEGCLGDIANQIRDGVSHNNIAPGTIYIGLEHIDRKNITLNKFGYSDNLQSNKYLFYENDILFGKLRPYFHKVTFAPFSGVCSTDILVIRAKSTKLFNYSLFAFYQPDVVEYANLGSEGTRMPRTNWNTLKQYPIFIPDDSLLNKYNEIVTHLINKIKYNQSQIRTFEKLRDTLLPKLMSGEVRVKI